MEQTAAFEDDRLKQALTLSLNGDAEAFADLVREHQGMVFSIAYHFLQDRSLAEDLAQEVFLELFQSIDRIQSPAHLTYWLRKVTSNRCIDQGRKKHRRREMALEEAPEPVDLFAARRSHASGSIAAKPGDAAGKAAHGSDHEISRRLRPGRDCRSPGNAGEHGKEHSAPFIG